MDHWKQSVSKRDIFHLSLASALMGKVLYFSPHGLLLWTGVALSTLCIMAVVLSILVSEQCFLKAQEFTFLKSNKSAKKAVTADFWFYRKATNFLNVSATAILLLALLLQGIIVISH